MLYHSIVYYIIAVGLAAPTRPLRPWAPSLPDPLLFAGGLREGRVALHDEPVIYK